MTYEAQTKAAILQRMLDASPTDIDKRMGSVTYDLLSPTSIELALAYVELDNVLRWGFAHQDGTGAYGTYLDLRCAEIGITRKAAVKSVGSVTLSGLNGTVIEKGTELSTGGESPVFFITTADVTISSGSVIVAAEAKVGGASGNVAAGAIKLVLGPLSGILAVTNAAPFDGGANTESDTALTQRYLDRMRKPITSGNANHYRAWALEVAGISDVKVYPIWSGNGTVKVVLLDDDKTAPSGAIVTDVADYIESVRPIGATVTVVGATEVPINVSVDVTLVAGAVLGDVQTAITNGVRDYLKTLAFKDPIVRYTKIANVVIDTVGVTDYTTLTVNGGTANITIADGSVAVIGTVTAT